MERIQGKKWEEFIGLVWFFCFVLFSGEPHIGNKDLHEGIVPWELLHPSSHHFHICKP